MLELPRLIDLLNSEVAPVSKQAIVDYLGYPPDGVPTFEFAWPVEVDQPDGGDPFVTVYTYKPDRTLKHIQCNPGAVQAVVDRCLHAFESPEVLQELADRGKITTEQARIFVQINAGLKLLVENHLSAVGGSFTPQDVSNISRVVQDRVDLMRLITINAL